MLLKLRVLCLFIVAFQSSSLKYFVEIIIIRSIMIVVGIILMLQLQERIHKIKFISSSSGEIFRVA